MKTKRQLLEFLMFVVAVGAVVNFLVVPMPQARYFSAAYVVALAGLFAARLKVGQK